MTIWSAEIKELETLYTSIKGRFPGLEKELERLVKANDENMVLLYSRRSLVNYLSTRIVFPFVSQDIPNAHKASVSSQNIGSYF
jgi:hypothetical protein